MFQKCNHFQRELSFMPNLIKELAGPPLSQSVPGWWEFYQILPAFWTTRSLVISSRIPAVLRSIHQEVQAAPLAKQMGVGA